MFPNPHSPSRSSPPKRPFGHGRGSSARPERPRISQTQLENYLRLQQQVKSYEQTRLELQRQLLALYDANAEIEEGVLGIERVESQAKIFSFGKVAAIVGEEYARNIKDQIDPTMTTYIKVVDRSCT